jgi:predicted nuclease of predicted toxin-antitoxin system
VPALDLVRALEALPEGTPDPEVLAWAAAEDRVLVTNDRNTLAALAHKRLAMGERMPGLIATTNEQSIGSAIEDIVLIAEYFSEEEIRCQIVVYLPFKG